MNYLKALGSSFWRDNRHWLVVVVAYLVFAEAATEALGYEQLGERYFRNLIAPSLGFFVLAVGLVVLVSLARHRPQRPLPFLAERFRTWRLDERTLSILVLVPMLQAFLMSFTSVKLGIPQVVPYYLDPLLAKIDGVIHFGQPWRYLHPWLGDPWATRYVDTLYYAWFAIFYFSIVGAAVWMSRPKLRAQFLLSFFLCWILLGTVGAYLLSSVGPCFYGQFYGDDPFADKMALLRAGSEQVHLGAVGLQEDLYRTVSTGERTFPFGISAMPSLHVAIAALLAIMAWKLNRWLGVLGLVYLLAILIGSVHLAWHYAIDGYFSILAVVLIWKLSGWLVRDQPGAVPEPIPAAAPAE